MALGCISLGLPSKGHRRLERLLGQIGSRRREQKSSETRREETGTLMGEKAEGNGDYGRRREDRAQIAQ